MDRALYIASGGSKEVMMAQAINAHNLSNANTVGFKKDLATAMSQPLYGPGHASRVYSLEEGLSADFSPGSMMSTGKELDVAVKGEGWIAVQAEDGEESYTRAGDLRISATGMLMTGAGHPVIGNNAGPIVLPPFEKIEIGAEGTITIRPLGQDAATLVVADRIKLVKPLLSELNKRDDGLFRKADGTISPADGSVSLVSGELEGSNVNIVDSMVDMMELARKYEMQIKVMDTANKNDGASAQLMSLG
jgi:flagellar basal-body rod protein FlgF